MKRIILDHFRRLWFRWSAFCLVNFILGLFIVIVGESVRGLIFIPVMFAFIFGPFLWLSELQSGYPRVVLGLPLTTLQIGRSVWWVSVGFTSILLAGFSLLGMISARLFFSSTHSNFEAWMLYVFIGAFMYGGVFGLFSGASISPSDNWLQRLRRYFYSITKLALVIAAIYFFPKDAYSTAFKLTAYFLICGALSILGWFRAEGLIVDYGEYRATSQQPKTLQGQFKVPNGFGGILFIFWTTFSRVWGMGILLLFGLNLWGLFKKHQLDWHHLVPDLGVGGGFLPFMFVFLCFSSFSLNQNWRSLRAMPISTGRLAAVLLFADFLPLLTLCLAVTALAWLETREAVCISFFKLELLAVAPVSVVIAISIWNTQANFINVVLLVIMILATIAPILYQLTYMDSPGFLPPLPLWFIIVFSVVIGTLSYWSTCQILARSSSAYRGSQNQLGSVWSWGR